MPAKLDFVINKGETFGKYVTWEDESGNPVNLTGYTARMQARPAYSASYKYIDMTTSNGKISINAGTGTITLTLSATETSGYKFTKAVYDLELVSSGGVVTRLIEGNITTTPEVTR